MPSRLPITAVIPAMSEARHIGECLRRLGRFERVVVVDSGSQDGTPDIARRHGAEVVQFRWDGRFPKKRNWFLRNCPVTTPWVLFLDADELVDDSFCDELEAVLPTTKHVGFWLNYDRWFLARRLRHGEANRKLALFRFGSGEYERIEESAWTSLDMEVHEHPILSGSVGEIRSRIDHREFRTMEHWIAKHNQYSTWEARRISALGGANNPIRASFNRRQRWKYSALGRWWLPPAHFFYSYVVRGGFLDGHAGFAYALAKSNYFWEIGLKVRETAATAGTADNRR
jgi:glycosyltransferase involved in cell wall biosynthesis